VITLRNCRAVNLINLTLHQSTNTKKLLDFKSSILLLGSSQLLELINKSQNSHFFLDEVDMTQNHVSSVVLGEISNSISKDNFLWIACQSDLLPTKKDPNLQGELVYICLIFYHAYKFLFTNYGTF
jgi:hypothetical protein